MFRARKTKVIMGNAVKADLQGNRVIQPVGVQSARLLVQWR
jgi:hypothetical protein